MGLILGGLMDDKKVGNLDFSKLNGEDNKVEEDEKKVPIQSTQIEASVVNSSLEEEIFNPSFTGGLSGGNKIAGMNRKQNKESKFSGGLIRPNKDNSNPYNISKLGGISR